MVRLLASLFCILIITFSSPLQAGEKRPNIVFCFADDWGRYAGCYAGLDGRATPSDVVKTPNIDSLARGGVLFERAYVNAPSCTPCRSALVSGRYFFQTGRAAILSGAQWDASIPSFPLILRESGYHIGETYKVWSPGTPNDAPFGSGKYAFEKAGAAFNNFSENATKLVRNGLGFETALEQLLSDVRNNFNDFHAACPADAPFLYWFGPTTVHRSWEKGSGRALWGIDPDSLRGKLPAFLPDIPEVREDFADYLGEIQAWDAAIGVLIERLKAVGQWENTVILVSGDHGAPGFPRGKCNLYDFGVQVALVAHGPGIPAGRKVSDFVNLMDLAPTFCELGGAKPPKKIAGRSLVPLLRSDRSGRIDHSRDFVVTGRERHVGSAREGNLPYPQRAIRTDDYLYIRNFAPERWPMGSPAAKPADSAELNNDTRSAFADMDASPTKALLVVGENDPKLKPFFEIAFAKRPGEELYHVKSDPDCMKNVAESSEHSAARRELSERLMRLLTEQADPRIVGSGDTFDLSPYCDPELRGGKKGK